MRFALIVTNLRGGGAEKAMLKLAALLGGRGHDVRIVLLEQLVEHAPPEGVAVHALGARGAVASKGWLGKRLAALRLRRMLNGLSRQVPFDLVVSTLPYADEVARLARLPRLWHRIANTLSEEVAALAKVSPAKAARRLRRYRHLYGSAPLVAVSEGVAADLRANLGLHAARIETIPNPFDFKAIRRLGAEEPPDLPREPYVVHVGRFARQKRHDLLLDAWDMAARPGKLVLLCEPHPELTALISRRGLQESVVVAGFKANPYPWMRAARLLVLCSDHEGLPNVLIEALALGTPVVSTDCPSGPREILGPGLANCLVPVGDAKALADAMDRAIAIRPDISIAPLERYAAPFVAAAWEALAQEP